MPWLSHTSGSSMPLMVGLLGLTPAVAARAPEPSEACASRLAAVRAAAAIAFPHAGDLPSNLVHLPGKLMPQHQGRDPAIVQCQIPDHVGAADAAMMQSNADIPRACFRYGVFL